MLNGFREFIMRGNVIDLAVGVIIGGAFGTVVNALVKSILMPAIALIFGEPSFDSWLVFGDIRVGVFLTAVVNFLLIAAALYFCIVMPINRINARRAQQLGLAEEEPDADPEIALLTEIRDALRAERNTTSG